MEADDVKELALDAFEILLPETLEKIHKLFALVVKACDKYREQKADDAFPDTVAGVEVEALARDMARFCQRFQADAALFPTDYRKRFLEAFLTQNPDVPRTPKLYNAVAATVNACFDKLEAAVAEKYSDGERVVLRQELLTQGMVDEAYRAVLDLRDTARDTNDIVRDIQGTVNRIANRPAAVPPLHTSNDDYKAWFERPLFLHVGKNDKVNLSNLFVKHKFKQRGQVFQNTVDQYLSLFLLDEDKRTERIFLFIEGDAGCGKTSLTQYMSYHYEQQDEIARQIFDDMRLITIRLREIEYIPTDCRTEQRLTRAILRFLYQNDHDNDNLKRFQESGPRLLWLDGYDELCTMEGIEDPQAVLWPLESLGCKIVVTSRPNYIRFDPYKYKSYRCIVLQHFDEEQRREWMENYETRCGEALTASKRQYLERADAAGICDTPMGLYMVAAGRFEEAQLQNEWALYYQIFHEEIKNTPYNKPFGGFDWQHPSAEDWESLYRVSEEIAWYLYRNKNEDLLVSYEKVDEIIEGLRLKGEKKELIKRCFALCGYWNTNTKQGCVEFYHNNIRDFFLCEKVMRELNAAYDKFSTSEDDILPLLECLCRLFQYDNLEHKVLLFLGQRAAYRSMNPDICIKTEQNCHNTERIFETLMLAGTPYSVCDNQENPVQIVARILRNTVGVYRYFYEAFLPEGEHIRWWKEENRFIVSQNKTFQYLCGEIFHFAGSLDLGGADLTGANLTDADLTNANLNFTNLTRTNLTRINLTNANLNEANLTRTNLTDADLTSANLACANLTCADLTDANLADADLHSTNLNQTNLTRVNLSDADLSDADLTNANLTFANLFRTNLVRTNLNRVDLSRAKIKECDMRYTYGEPITD